ncbi:MAG: Ldh family oxidoreductase [Patescibacteria group bacterium]
MKISVDELRSLVQRSLETIYPKQQSALMTEIMMYAQLAGIPSHGPIRLVIDKYGILFTKPEKEPELHRRTKISRRIDGNGNPGMLVAGMAMQEALSIAKEHDVAVVSTNGCWSTSGALSYYAETIAREGFIALFVSQSVPGVVPYGAKKPLFGTNPIGFGIPAQPDPIVFDMATSVTTYGDLARAKRAGETLAEGIAFDSEGEPTTDPAAALNGGVAPFDFGYKGSGLGMMVEILGGVLSGASFLGIREPQDGWGNLLLVLNPQLVMDADEYYKRISEFVDHYLEAPVRQGHKLRLPGSGTIARRHIAESSGEVEIDDAVVEEVRAYLLQQRPE